MKWTHQYDATSPRVEMELDKDVSLPEVLKSFDVFLRAVGYDFDGHLDIVNEEED